MSCSPVDFQTVFLIRFTWPVLLGLLYLAGGCSPTISAQSTRELDERYGFREMKFGMHVDTLLKNTVLYESKKDGLYEKIADEMMVDGCEVQQIRYEACDRLLCGVHIKADVNAFYCFRNRIEKRYGLPTDKTYVDGAWQYWWTGDRVGLMLVLKTGETHVRIWSRKLTQLAPIRKDGTTGDF